MTKRRAGPDEPPAGSNDGPARHDRSGAIDTDFIETAAAMTLLRAWDRWRGSRLLPTRAGMELTDISSVLPYLVLLEVRAADDIVFRLAGTALCAALGRELKDTDYLQWASNATRSLRIARIQHLVTHPCGAVTQSTHRAASGLVFRTEELALPIRPVDAGSPMQVIGVVSLLPGEPQPYTGQAQEIGRLHDVYRFIDIGAGVPPA